MPGVQSQPIRPLLQENADIGRRSEADAAHRRALSESSLRRLSVHAKSTDQGAQFTANAFTDVLKSHHVQTSMDGRGRVQDNIFIERLWWSFKYQYLYLWSLDNGAELRKGLDQWFNFCNSQRSHQSLDNKTPDEVYVGLPHPLAKAA